MEFDQLKLVGGLSAFFILLGFGCWLLLQTATMEGGPNTDFMGELCVVTDTSSSDALTPCKACVALSHQLASQAVMLGPMVIILPGISAYSEPLTGEQ